MSDNQVTLNRFPQRKRRVAHVTLGLDMGGQEKLLVEFARHADRRRFDLHVVSLGSRGVLADDIEACGCPVTALDEPAGFRVGLLCAWPGCSARERIDVVHTHDDRPLIYGAVAARLARVPASSTRHHGHGRVCRARQARLVNCWPGLTDRFVLRLERQRRHRGRQGDRPRKVRLVWNGIDTTRFRFAPDAATVRS